MLHCIIGAVFPGNILETAVIAVKVSTDACEKHAFSPSKVSITDPMTIGFGFYDN